MGVAAGDRVLVPQVRSDSSHIESNEF
jgi:hypothetical protein